MKTNLKFYSIHFFLLLVLIISCRSENTNESDSNTNSNSNNGDNNSPNNRTIIVFENNNYSGGSLIKFTDNTSVNANFENGVLKLGSQNSIRTIRSVTPDNQIEILIGRKEGDSIILNYNSGNLNFRLPQNGIIPISTFAEFQLINKNQSSLAGNYSLKKDLDFMSEEWIPIGTSTTSFYKGIFLGNNHQIENLKINTSTYENIGLFGVTGPYSEIKNITIKSGQVYNNVANYAGAIVANGNLVSGCINYAEVKGNGFVGGIAGTLKKNIINCTNFGNVENLRGGATGGIVGALYSLNSNETIENCINKGKVNGKKYTGGIIGLSYLNIKNCTNEGEVNAFTNSTSGTGGIFGFLNSNLREVINCHNKGNVNSDFSSSGIGENPNKITNCSNTGKISGNTKVAGIAISSNDVNDTFNSGDIEGKESVAGIVVDGSGNFINCHNTGFIKQSLSTTSNSSVGGIISSANSINVLNCYNIGKIDGTHFTGGLIGTVGSGGTNIVKSSFNNNDIKSQNLGVGGLIGYVMNSSVEISSSYNKGNISGSFTNNGSSGIGGLVGGASINYPCKISFCYNSGAVVGGLTVNNLNNASGFIGGNYYYTAVFTANYWRNDPNDNATNPIGAATNVLAKEFSNVNWPTIAEGWKIGNGNNDSYWKSLGNWNNGSPIYPKLYYEN